MRDTIYVLVLLSLLTVAAVAAHAGDGRPLLHDEAALWVNKTMATTETHTSAAYVVRNLDGVLVAIDVAGTDLSTGLVLDPTWTISPSSNPWGYSAPLYGRTDTMTITEADDRQTMLSITVPDGADAMYLRAKNNGTGTVRVTATIRGRMRP